MSRALRYKLLVVLGMQVTDVPWVSQAFSFSSQRDLKKRDSGTRLMTTASRHEAAENEQISVRQEDIC